MSREWKPGDLAVATVRGVPNVRVMRMPHAAPWWVSSQPKSSPVIEDHDVADVRPLVVIDPEDREQVERLWSAWRDSAPDHRLAQDNMQAALREFANPKPPKPEEPAGHAAVVEDADGLRWINWRDPRATGYHERPWVLASDSLTSRDYADIDAVRVLSEGVS